jgi:hypothetical protein
MSKTYWKYVRIVKVEKMGGCGKQAADPVRGLSDESSVRH